MLPATTISAQRSMPAGQGIGSDADDLDLHIGDAVSIRVQLEDRAARAVRCADQVADRIDTVVGVELEVLIARQWLS